MSFFTLGQFEALAVSGSVTPSAAGSIDLAETAVVHFGPIATVARCPRYVRCSPDSDQIADAPTRAHEVRPAPAEFT